MSELVGDAANEDGVVLAEGNLTVLLVDNEGGGGLEVGDGELGEIELPGIAAAMGAVGVVGGFVGKSFLFFVPSREVTKDEECFVVGIEAGFLEGGEAFLTNVAAGSFVVIGEGFLAADEVDFEEVVFVFLEGKGEGVESVTLHLLTIEVLDVSHDFGESLAVSGGGLAIRGGPVDDLEGAGSGGGVFVLPSGEDLGGGFCGGFCLCDLCFLVEWAFGRQLFAIRSEPRHQSGEQQEKGENKRT